MTRIRQVLIVAGVALVAIIALRPTIGPRQSRSEKDRAAVEVAADRLTHQEVADAWAQSKLGNTRPMERIQKTFPLPARAVHEEGTGIVLTFTGHNETCSHF